jgi:GDP-mannose transporter
MAANCMSQAAYVLYMKQAQKVTKLSEWGSAYYNNFLSIFVLGGLAVLNGELATVFEFPALTDSMFIAAVVSSGFIGTALSLSVFWLVKVTSPTSYSMIGALNKIPVTIVSVFIFHTVLTLESTFSLTVGLASGVVYTYAKYQETLERQRNAIPPLQQIQSK